MSRFYKPLFYCLLFCLSAGFLSAKEPVRLKDIALFQGIKENQLMGFGLVTGLQGQGDSKNFGLTQMMLHNLASNYGFKIEEKDLQSKNIAAVLVTAKSEGFCRIGDHLDVMISSIGDAKSINGGILLQTSLKAANNQIYAVAQGRIIAGNRSTQTSTSGSIPNGAIIEKEIISQFINSNKLNIILKRADFTTANLIRETVLTINPELNITAIDAGLIEIELGEEELKNPINFISQLEALTLTPDYKAAVIIDKKSGVIVAGSDIVIQECSVSTPSVQLQIGSTAKKDHLLLEAKTVGDLVNLLNQASLKSNEIIALLEAVHKAGALNANLIIL